MFQTLVSNGMRCAIAWDVLLWCHREFHFVAVVEVKVNTFLRTVKHSNRPKVYIFFKMHKNKHTYTPVSSTGFHWQHLCQNTKQITSAKATEQQLTLSACGLTGCLPYVKKGLCWQVYIGVFQSDGHWPLSFWVELGLDSNIASMGSGVMFYLKGFWQVIKYKWSEGFQFCAGS